MFAVETIPIKTDNQLVLAHLEDIVKAPKFINFFNSLNQDKLDIDHIRIDNAKWFCGPNSISPEKLGFLYMEVVAKDKRTGKPVAGVVFLRGGAVAIHLELECDGEVYVAVTRQMRLPTGDDREEIPAGMIDASDNIAGVAVKELEEETGVKIGKAADLVSLGKFYPSQGGCDEHIHLYYKRATITRRQMSDILEKIHGEDPTESIKIRLIPLVEYEKYLDTMEDSKAEVAWRRVLKHKNNNVVKPYYTSFCSLM